MPQTLTEIRATLEAAGLRPRKRFGQNFLVDHNLLKAMVDLADVDPGDVVLEVGPGTGTLTDALLDTGARVLAVEIDRGLTRLLRHRYADRSRFRLLHCDVLAGKHTIHPDVVAGAGELGGSRIRLVSNLPYNIATPLICECLLSSLAADRGHDDVLRVSDLTVTVQREVAQRLTAEPGVSAYGPASVVIALLGSVRPGRRVPATAFWPRPKVAGQMLRIDFRPPSGRRIFDARTLTELVAWAFGQRRKMIGSATRQAESPFAPAALAAALAAAQVDPHLRPERITPEQFARMAQALTDLGR